MNNTKQMKVLTVALVAVSWKTSAAETSVLQYGVDGSLSEQAPDLTPMTDHELTIGIRPRRRSGRFAYTVTHCQKLQQEY